MHAARVPVEPKMTRIRYRPMRVSIRGQIKETIDVPVGLMA
uniref:Uncharacterized protein n=1 Tax=Arundo donax TaxID=35708 RepID=A0A0A9H149_ARUDO